MGDRVSESICFRDKSGELMPKTSFKKIFNYWKDKEITKDGEVILGCGYGGQYVKEAIEVIVDWGEPQCWCCGKIIPAEDNPKYEEMLNNGEIEDIWELKEVKSRLQRCHIIPNMLGGEDKPENLFLMCPQCHSETPDTKYPNLFFKYIYGHRIVEQDYLSKAIDILEKDYGITKPVFDDVDEIFKNDIGQHGGATHSNSIILGFVGNALEHEKERKGDISMLMDYLNREIQKSEDLRAIGLYTDVDHERHETLLEIKKVLEVNDKSGLPVK